MNELQLLKQEVEALKAWKRSLESSHSIPLNIDQSFRARLIKNSGSLLTTSGKSATSENQGVNESGALSYSVLGPPDKYVEITIGGVVNYIPAYL